MIQASSRLPHDPISPSSTPFTPPTASCSCIRWNVKETNRQLATTLHNARAQSLVDSSAPPPASPSDHRPDNPTWEEDQARSQSSCSLSCRFQSRRRYSTGSRRTILISKSPSSAWPSALLTRGCRKYLKVQFVSRQRTNKSSLLTSSRCIQSSTMMLPSSSPCPRYRNLQRIVPTLVRDRGGTPHVR